MRERLFLNASMMLGFEEFKDIIRVADLSLRCETFATLIFTQIGRTEFLLFVELENNNDIINLSQTVPFLGLNHR